MDQFYRDAASGTLPNFSWINPRSGINVTSGIGSNDQHPDHDVNAGEQYYKDIYEALRASPLWNVTLFIVTFDEHGGFYDHVTPPENIPPPNDGESSYPDDFGFDRLGIRVPTLVISPWVRKGVVLSKPPPGVRPFPDSEFDHTSIISTVRRLFGLDPTPLTDRDNWSAPFDFLIDDTLIHPRTDCPVHLPDPIPPVLPDEESRLPLNSLQMDISKMISRLNGKNVTHLGTQAEYSMWIQAEVKEYMDRWRLFTTFGNVSSYKVVTQPYPLYRSGVDDDTWNLNGIPHGGNPAYANSTRPFITLSLMSLTVSLPNDSLSESSPQISLCLDASEGTEGTILGVAPCFPSPDPSLNFAESQHFIFPGDGTLRFYDPFRVSRGESLLCVTNHDPNYFADDNSVTLVTTLEDCEGKVEQSWGYHGSAPGQAMQGYLFYGDSENSLGVVDASV